MYYGDLEWKIALSVTVCPLLRTVFQTAVPHEWNCCRRCPRMNQYYDDDCNHKSQYFQLLDKDWKYWMSDPNFLSWLSAQWHGRTWICKSHKYSLNIITAANRSSCRFYYSGINHWNWMSVESFIWFTHLLPLLQEIALVKYLFSHFILTTNCLPQGGLALH